MLKDFYLKIVKTYKIKLMKKGHQITMLGTGFIGSFYTEAIHGIRGRDRIKTVCGLPLESAEKFARKWDIPRATDNMKEAINDQGRSVDSSRQSSPPSPLCSLM